MTLLSVLSYEHNVVSGLSTKSAENKKTGDKAIIFLFSDGLKSQFTNANQFSINMDSRGHLT